MKPKQLIILVAALAVAAVVALLVKSNRSGSVADGSDKEGSKLLPELPVNEIAQMKIVGPENAVHLARKDGGGDWTVVDRDGYAADFDKLQRFVKDIAELKITQVQKVGASMLGRVGLTPPETEDGEKEEKATRIEMLNSEGNEIKTLLMGKRFEAPSSQEGAGGGSQGRYIKLDDSGEVYVVSTVFWNLESEPENWLDKESFSVAKHKSVTVTHPGEGGSFTLFREEEGGDLKLKDAEEGKELDTGTTGGLGNAFSSASFVDVLTGEAKAEDKTGLDKPVKIDIDTFEGFNYSVSVGGKNEDDRYPLTFTVSADLPEKREVEEGAEETEEEKKSRDEAFENEQKRLKEKLEKESKLVGNVYLVENWTVERILKKRDDLFKKEEDNKDGSTPSTSVTTPAVPVPLRPPEGGDAGTDGTEKKRITATTPPISIKDGKPVTIRDGKPVVEEKEPTPEQREAGKELEEELRKAVDEGASESEGDGSAEKEATEGEAGAEEPAGEDETVEEGSAE